jgi:hypothetical protein
MAGAARYAGSMRYPRWRRADRRTTRMLLAAQALIVGRDITGMSALT